MRTLYGTGSPRPSVDDLGASLNQALPGLCAHSLWYQEAPRPSVDDLGASLKSPGATRDCVHTLYGTGSPRPSVDDLGASLNPGRYPGLCAHSPMVQEAPRPSVDDLRGFTIKSQALPGIVCTLLWSPRWYRKPATGLCAHSYGTGSPDDLGASLNPSI